MVKRTPESLAKAALVRKATMAALAAEPHGHRYVVRIEGWYTTSDHALDGRFVRAFNGEAAHRQAEDYAASLNALRGRRRAVRGRRRAVLLLAPVAPV